MVAEGTSEIRIDEALASQVSSDTEGPGARAGRTPKIPVALSSDDLHELTVALTSYIERQSLVATSG